MGFYNNAGGIVHPTTKEELAEEISIRLDRGQTNLNDIDTSKITDMSSLFYHVFQRRAVKDIDVSLWNTSNVTSMSYMFFGCSIFNCDISNWDVSKVNNMTCMFYGCYLFNQNLDKWNVGKRVNVREMFEGSGVMYLPIWYFNNSKLY